MDEEETTIVRCENKVIDIRVRVGDELSLDDALTAPDGTRVHARWRGTCHANLVIRVNRLGSRQFVLPEHEFEDDPQPWFLFFKTIRSAGSIVLGWCDHSDDSLFVTDREHQNRYQHRCPSSLVRQGFFADKHRLTQPSR
jgi:hypothetical protein